MNMLIRFLFRFQVSGFILLLVSGCATTINKMPDDVVPPVVAVTSFDNRTSFEGQWKLGSGMADLLVSELLDTGDFVVVERANLGNVVNELDLQGNKLFRSEGKVDSGRLKNARYLVRGVVNDFSQVGGASIFIAVKSIIFGGRGHKARVSLTLTIVDVESGEIVNSVQCAGNARAKQAYTKGTYKNVAFGGDAFFKTPLGTATGGAIRRGVNGIIKKIPKVHWRPMIADVTGKQIIVNGGADKDFRVGALYIVNGEGRVITDPVTGDRLETLTGPVMGTIRITDVRDKISFAQPVSGGTFKRGQHLLKK